MVPVSKGENRMRKIMSIPVLLVTFALVGCATTSTAPKLCPIGDSGQWLPGKIIWRDLATPSPDPCRKFYTGLCGWEFEPVQDNGYCLIRSGGEPVGGWVDANKLGRKPETAPCLCVGVRGLPIDPGLRPRANFFPAAKQHL
jgi:hypothetical protein